MHLVTSVYIKFALYWYPLQLLFCPQGIAYCALVTWLVNKTTPARWSMMNKRKGWLAMKRLMTGSSTAYRHTHSAAIAAAVSDPSSFTSTTAFAQSTEIILKLPNRCPCRDDGRLIMCKAMQVSNCTSCELLIVDCSLDRWTKQHEHVGRWWRKGRDDQQWNIWCAPLQNIRTHTPQPLQQLPLILLRSPPPPPSHKAQRNWFTEL